MPKSIMDWFAIVMLWLGAAIMAFQGTNMSPAPGAPSVIGAEVWRFAPVILVSLAMVIMIWRGISGGSPSSSQIAAPPRPPFLDDFTRRYVVIGGMMMLMWIVTGLMGHFFPAAK